MIERRLIEVEGLVQGVGFRPFVHELATRLALRGSVRNDATGVSIDIEGEGHALDAFLQTLSTDPPPLAVIERVTLAPAATAAQRGFRIAPSVRAKTGADTARVAPDLATCADCLRELFDPDDRRYRYAFLSCSRCGPRLTIAQGVPYDRHRTTMGTFPMCARCRAEYDDPRDRRFHAQTIACHACGPRLTLYAASGAPVAGLTDDIVLRRAVVCLEDGGIVAVKGLGGFHLACDATSSDAVQRLRSKKRREAKPLAMMVRTLDDARALCVLSDADAALLSSPQRPIVLLPKRRHVLELGAADDVAPGSRYLGLMLPYTPLHHLLLADTDRPLVMTSGNMSDEPIAYRDDDALARLAEVTDLVLLHDREIAVRCDDSVVQTVAGGASFVRRSRGYAPYPLSLASEAAVPTLGVGAHLKNTFCIVKGRAAFVSHHIGDLQNGDAFQALEESIQHYCTLIGVEPEIIAHDLHPNYLSTRLAEQMSVTANVERVGVQHHHAHILSCVAEHGVSEPVIGVAFDGTGLGTDGAIWGGEFLVVDGGRFDRLAHLSYVPLPGGDAAIRHPWRAAVAHLLVAYEGELSAAPKAFLARIDPAQLALVRQTIARPSLSPMTSSMGRLFDAVAALLGIRLSAAFEAQAAMELEALTARSASYSYPVDINDAADGWTVDCGSLIRGVVRDIAAGRGAREIATAFHVSLCEATTDVVARIARRTGIRRVALSGGVFQNAVLTGRLTQMFCAEGFTPLVHRRVPCNDGGLSLGQAYAAALHTSASSRACV